MSSLFHAALAAALLALAVWLQRRLGVFFEYLYFCRFPLLTGLALAVLPAVALFGAPSLLGNLFSLSPWEILFVSLLATLAAWMVMITLEILIAHGPARFRVRRLELPAWLVRHRVPLFSLLALPVALTAAAQSPPPLAAKLAAVAGGMALAALLFLLAAHNYRLLGGTTPLVGEGPSADEPEAPGSGYVNAEWGVFLSGHLLAFFAFTGAVVLYSVGYFLLRPDRNVMPSLGYLLLLLLVVGWGLPGASFFFDRYRVPVLLVLLVCSFLSSRIFDTDHYYRIERETAPAAPMPAQAYAAAERREAGPERPIVVVAASGGGITASLWTARVLTALQSEVGTDFTRSIRLISSVSGGSVGTLYFLDRFTPQGPPPPAALAPIVDAAGASSLDATAWGIAYPDLWRVLFGFLLRDKSLDRGWAMEQAWKRHLAEPERRLSQWRAGLRAGWLPAAVFNSTVVETGEQFLLTPLDLPPSWPTRRFYDVYPGYDLRAVTAARLSATFPWVSPITQARSEDGRPPRGFRQLHLADGGYFDNDGIVTAVNWLRSLVPAHLDDLRRRGVLLVRIRAFPQKEPLGGADDARRGWLYATAGPILSMYNVRTSTQAFHNDVEVSLLKEMWERGFQVKLTPVLFELREKAPLSWKLTQEERDAVLRGWTEPRNQAALSTVKALFPP